MCSSNDPDEVAKEDVETELDVDDLDVVVLPSDDTPVPDSPNVVVLPAG